MRINVPGRRVGGIFCGFFPALPPWNTWLERQWEEERWRGWALLCADEWQVDTGKSGTTWKPATTHARALDDFCGRLWSAVDFLFFRKIFPGPRHVDEKLSIHAIVKSRFSIFRGTRCGPQRLDTRIRMFAVVHLLLRLIYRKRRALNEIMNRIASETQNKDRFGFLWFFLCRIVKQRLMGSLKQPLMTTALCRHNDRPLPSIVFQLVTLKTATDSDRIGKLLFDFIDALAVLTATGRSKTFCASKRPTNRLATESEASTVVCGGYQLRATYPAVIRARYCRPFSGVS